MNADKAPRPAGRTASRFSWLNLGEIMAVLAVVIAALSYWDAHRDRAAAIARQTSEARAQSAFLMVGSVGDKGREIDLRPLGSDDAIQAQRLIFPKAVVDHPVDIVAAQPRILADWIAPGMDRLLDRAHAKGEGRGRLPIAVITTYVRGDATLTDRSEYVVGYAWRGRFLASRRIDLEGLSLVRRGLRGDPAPAVERRWAQVAPAAPEPPAAAAAAHPSGSAPT